MGTAYPGALDDTSGDIPLTGANPDTYLGSTVDSGVDFTHPSHHEMLAGATEALEAKVGIGASTPTSGTTLVGTGAGTSAWEARGIRSVVITASGSDDAPTINAAIQAATGPLILDFPDTAIAYRIGSQIVVDRDNVFFRGVAEVQPNTADDYTRWFVTASWSGPVLLFDKGAGTGTPYVVWGGGLSGIHIDGATVADDGISVITARGLSFRDFSVTRCTGTAVYFGGHGGWPGDTYDNVSSVRMSRFSVTTTNGVCLDIGRAAYGLSFSEMSLVATGAAGVCIDIYGCDDIWFRDYSTLTQTVGGVNLRLNGSDYAGVGSPGAVSFVSGWHGGNKSIVVTGDGLDVTPRRNLFLGLGTEDGEAVWTADVGSAPSYVDVEGRHNLRQHGKTTASVQDDFMSGNLTSGSIGELGWAASGTIAYVAATASHPGVLRLSTGASSGTTVYLALRPDTSSGVVLPADPFDIEFILAPFVVDANTIIRFGLADLYDTHPPTNGIYWEKQGADTNWYAVCRASGTATRSTAQDAVGTSFQRFRIRRHNNAEIGFDIGDTVNGNNDYRISTNIPTATLTPFVQVRNTAAESKGVDIDWFQLHINGLSR